MIILANYSSDDDNQIGLGQISIEPLVVAHLTISHNQLILKYVGTSIRNC